MHNNSIFLHFARVFQYFSGVSGAGERLPRTLQVLVSTVTDWYYCWCYFASRLFQCTCDNVVSVKYKSYINDRNMLERECDSTVSLTYFCETDEPDCRVHVLPSDGGKWLYVYPIEDIFFCLACGWVAVFILFSFTYVHSYVPQLPSTLSFWRSRISKWQLRKRERGRETVLILA